MDFIRTAEGRAALNDELADVLIYLVRLADVTGVDLREAAETKIAKNRMRFPPMTSS